MARSEVLGYVDESLRQSANATDLLARYVSDGTLSPGDWDAKMRDEIKEEYIRMYTIGRGGRDQMGPQDWGSVGGSLAEQYWYLDRKADSFLDAVASGRLSEAQIRVRAQMYVDSAREAHERGYARAKIEAGMDEVRWVVDPAKENCEGCLAFQAMGWQPVASDPFGGCYPGSACTPCKTACGCHLEYRKSNEE